jgi:hypothetical protein
MGVDIAEICEQVSSLLADNELTHREAGQVLERLVAQLCMDHERPSEAASGMCWNIQKFVELRQRELRQRGKS